METYTFPHFHPSHSVVHLTLFHSLQNAANLLSQIIAAASLPSGHPDQVKVDYAFIDADMVVSRDQVLNAVLQSMIWKERDGGEVVHGGGGDGLKTKTIHSEVIWNLFPARNISSSLREIGLSPKTTSLLLVHITSPTIPPSEVLSRMTSLVQGTLDPHGLTSLDQTTNAKDESESKTNITTTNTNSATMITTRWEEVTRLYKLDSSRLDMQGKVALVESATAIKNVSG